jgi:hypothetical protein
MSFHLPRERAEQLLVDLGIDSAPIPVEKIARALKLDVVFSDLGNDVSGVLVTGGPRVRICIQKTDAPARKRFTMAHEIGHFHLGHRFAPGEHVHVDRGYVIQMRSPRSSTGEDKLEVEANQFAAALLMPKKLVRAAVEDEGGAPVEDSAVGRLARKFQVSEQAMTIRLTVLGLL